ncbi:MAG TPA: putative Ig domain-containing protein [Steroidobacteraceae bacterium]
MRTLFSFSCKTSGGLLASAVLAMSLSTISHATTTIAGKPATSVAANSYYGFQSWATDNDNRAVTYSIKNKPAWATFDTRYGHLYGVPTSANVGTYASIVISASDGLSSASLPAFSITVTGKATGGGTTGGSSSTTGSAMIQWNPPTQNTNGSALTNLAGYMIRYGTSAKSLASSVKVANPGLTSYQIDGLAAGTYYFAIAAYNSAGQTSSLSSLVSKIVK